MNSACSHRKPHATWEGDSKRGCVRRDAAAAASVQNYEEGLEARWTHRELGLEVPFSAGGKRLANHFEQAAAEARDDAERDHEALVLERDEEKSIDQQPRREERKQHQRTHLQRRIRRELLSAILEPLSIGRDQLTDDRLERIPRPYAIVAHQPSGCQGKVRAETEAHSEEDGCDQVHAFNRSKHHRCSICKGRYSGR